MKIFPTNLKKPTFDVFGFPHIWVPFGLAGDILNRDGSVAYTVRLESILNEESINTLSGTPVYIYHPDITGGLVNPDNIENTKTVGVCTDTYRLVEGGGEVLVKLIDSRTHKEILDKKITCVSPGYITKGNIRHYNHIALLPPGLARGGDKMAIKLESYNGIDLPDNNLIEFYNFKLEKQNYMELEQLVGQVLAGQAVLAESVSSLSAKLNSYIETEMAEASLEGETEPKLTEDEKYLEGFNAGKEAGNLIATASSYGFEGVEVNEAETYLINKAYPTMKLEGFSPAVLKGVLVGAVETLKSFKETVKSSVEVVVESVPLVVDATPKKTGTGVVNRIPVKG
jgi:hypothetical protein